MRIGCRRRLLILSLCVPLTLAGCKRDGARTHPADAAIVPVAKAPFVSGKRTKVYHRRACQYARDIPDRELTGFGSRPEAAAAGRIPCAYCRPDEDIGSEDAGPGSPGKPRPGPANE